MLEAFQRLQENLDIVTLSATTLRALNRALPLVNREFREDPKNRARFMKIIGSERLTWTLRRMSRYGLLGRYLPAFGRIVGQMQHDLFHVYTVDEHILMVIRNLRPLPHPALRPRVPAALAADAGVRQARDPVPGRPLPRHRQGAAAATTRTWLEGRGALLPRPRLSKADASWWPGSSSSTCRCRPPRRSRTSPIPR
jgi:hypothetical protein